MTENESSTDAVKALPNLDPVYRLHPDSRMVAFLTDFIGEENPVLLRAAIENVARALAKHEAK